jgi:CheY-like chemotaxis protein
VPKTLLAVDDSATMRKVLEITFSGEDYRIVTADSSQAALAKLSEEPKIFVIDTALGSDDGYALSREVRKRDGSATIVLLASRHNPYDAAKGKDAGADDYMDKPFDTQQMVDKVRKAIAARESGGVAAPAAAAADVGRTQIGVPVAPPPARPAAAAPAPAPSPAAAKPAPAAAAAPAAPAGSRAHTLMFGGEPQTKPGTVPAAPSPAAAAAKPAAAAAAPAARPAAAAPPAAPSPAPPKVAPVPAAAATAPPPAAAGGVAAKVNGQLSSKLGELGLTPQQVEGVLALSRDVVERVVWEVVPELAEALIKEEIARLMKA